MAFLFSPLTKLEFEIDAILRKKLDKQLYSPKMDDILRLLKLKMWSQRYHVSLDYILVRLIPHFEKLASRHYVRRSGGNSKGLGVSVAVLTGPAAEEKLREFISKDFPDDEHIAMETDAAKTRCLAALDRLDRGRPRPILQYKSVSEFVKSYSMRIDKARRTDASIERKLSKQPWRGNPWR